MKVLLRCIAAFALALAVSWANAQRSILLDELSPGPGIGAPRTTQQGESGALGGLELQGLQGGAESSLPSVVNRQLPRPPQSELAKARRRVQEIELRQLHQQLDELESGSAAPNAFQTFVLQSTGRNLPIFGANLFRNTPSTFAPVDNVPVTPDYLIGPGDEIVVNGWGQINVDLALTVDRNGNINVPRVGTVHVSGLKYQDLTSHLKTAFGRIYRNFELTATLGQLRSIQVFVVGQARRPGTYTVSSLSTLVTAIFAAGGPSNTGSMRSIQLKRDNRLVVDFDLYDLLLTGDKSRDQRLMPGDIIQFTPVGSLLALTGAVNTPAIFELKQDTPLFDVLRWAGGLATTAQGQKVTVERIEDRKSRKVEEFALDVSGLSKPLRDGDLVVVRSLLPRFDNAITLRGNVAEPRRFPWREGIRVRDLIPEKEALISREYVQSRNQLVGLDSGVASILRQQSAAGTHLTVDDLNQRPMQRHDQPDSSLGDAILRRQRESQAARFLSGQESALGQSLLAPPSPQSGEQQRLLPQEVLRLEQQQREELAKLEAAKTDAAKLLNQIRPSQFEVNWDYALIERTNPQELTTRLIPFNLAKALEGDPQHNLPLQRGDIVTIFSKDDIQVPISRRTKYVRLEGEFNHSGVYEVLPGETLRQLVVRAGGVTPNAYLFGAMFTRESTRIEQQKKLEDALNRFERDIHRANMVRSQNVTVAEDAASLKQQSDSQQELLRRLRQVRATGRIVLEIPETGATKDIPDLGLEDGDRLFVPAPPSMVSVFGSVYSENSFIYSANKQVSDYLAQAGGPTGSADKSSAYVLRADGSVIAKQHSGFLSNFDGKRLMPGDSIVVPEDLDRTTVTRGLKDVAQIFYQFALGAAAIKVLKQ